MPHYGLVLGSMGYAAASWHARRHEGVGVLMWTWIFPTALISVVIGRA
jgi:hypothetical protein